MLRANWISSKLIANVLKVVFGMCIVMEFVMENITIVIDEFENILDGAITFIEKMPRKLYNAVRKSFPGLFANVLAAWYGPPLYIGLILLAVSGIIAFIALIWSYGGGWFPALTALISGGYFFAELDGELCGKRESAVEPIRFLGIAIGAFAANYMHYSGVSFWGFFAVVIALRGWSFFRS